MHTRSSSPIAWASRAGLRRVRATGSVLPTVRRLVAAVLVATVVAAGASIDMPAAQALDTGQGPFLSGVISPPVGGTFSDDQGNECKGGKCRIGYGDGKQVDVVVTYTAHADPGYTFSGWSGACKGTGKCAIEIAGDDTTPDYLLGAAFAVAVTATPTPTGKPTTTPTTKPTAPPTTPPTQRVPGNLRLRLTATGPGGIAMPGAPACAGTCDRFAVAGTRVTLTATPGPGAVLLGWGGDCADAATTPTCALTVTAAMNVSAGFGTRAPAAFTAVIHPPAGATTTAPAASVATVGPHTGGTVRYLWDFEGTGRFTSCGTAPLATHQYADPGTYQVGLRVITSTGSASTAQTSLTVSGAAAGGTLPSTVATDGGCASPAGALGAGLDQLPSASQLLGDLSCLSEVSIDTLDAVATTGCFRPVDAVPGQVGTAGSPPRAGASAPVLEPTPGSTPTGSYSGRLGSARFFRADGAVRLNGLDLTPVGADRIYLTPDQDRIDADHVRITIHGGEAANGGRPMVLAADASLHLVLPDATADGVVIPFGAFDLGPASGISVLGLALAGVVQVTMSTDGRAVLTVNIQLPDELHDIDGGAVTAQVEFVADATGVHLDSLNGEAQDLTLGPLTVNDLHLSYLADDGHGGHDVWDVVVDVSFENVGGIDGEVAVANGQLRRLAIGANFDPGVPFVFGTTIDEIHFEVSTDATGNISLGGGLHITYGPTVPVFGHDEKLIEVDGDLQYHGSSSTWQLALTGVLKIIGIQLATAEVDVNGNWVTGAGGFEVQGHIDIDPFGNTFWGAPVLRVRADVDGGVVCHGDCDFMVSLDADACVLGVCGGASGIISSTGFGVCLDLAGWDVGGGYTWGAGGPTLMLSGCALTPWQVSLATGDVMGLAPHAAATTAGFRVPARLQDATTVELAGAPETEQVIAVRGVTAPPAVVVTGPDGQSVTANPRAGRPVTSGRYLVLTSPTDKTTYVLISKAPAGTYTVTPERGSAPIDRIETSTELPAPAITASVGPAAGGAMALRYAYTAAPGRTVRFLERGGHAQALLGDATGDTGTLTFTPADGDAGDRSIVAIVSTRGVPQQAVVVAHYQAPARTLPARVRGAGVAYADQGLDVSWQPAGGGPAPTRYAVVARFADGRDQQFLLDPAVHGVHVPAVYPGERVTLTIAGLTDDGVAGARVVLTYPAPTRTGSGQPSWVLFGMALLLVLAAGGVLLVRRRMR